MSKSMIQAKLWIPVALCLMVSAASAAILINDNFKQYPTGRWAEGSVHGNWRVAFNGYGYQAIVANGNDKLLEQAPKASQSVSETHSSLALTQATLPDFQLSVVGKTIHQLRKNSPPNPWEVDWVLWHYTDNQHFYYLTCKPNGWELGKEDPAYPGAQRFLQTGTQPRCFVGTPHTYSIHQSGATITASIDSQPVASYTDRERPYLSGAFGLYNEDAQVQWDNFSASSLK